MLNANHLVLYFQKNGANHYELNEELIENAVSVYFTGEWKNYIGPVPLEKESKKPIITQENGLEFSKIMF